MSHKVIAIFALIAAIFSSRANADDPCEILARSLRQDTFAQGTSSEQFSQFQQLVKNDDYRDWGNASSSSHTFNGTLSITDEVDLALGNGDKSDSSNWEKQRKKFLAMVYSDTSASYRSSSHSRQANIAAIQAITNCANHLADSEGVFAQLVNVTPNRDAFSLRLWRRTSGMADWKLKNLSPQPQAGADFGCDNGWERATNDKQLPLTEQGTLIECHKNPNKHVIVTVQTSAGPAGSFELDSVVEEIQSLRNDMNSKIGQIQSQLAGLDGKFNVLSASLGSSRIIAMIEVVDFVIIHSSPNVTYDRNTGVVTFPNPQNLKPVPVVSFADTGMENQRADTQSVYVKSIPSSTAVVVFSGALDVTGQDQKPGRNFTAVILGF